MRCMGTGCDRLREGSGSDADCVVVRQQRTEALCAYRSDQDAFMEHPQACQSWWGSSKRLSR